MARLCIEATPSGDLKRYELRIDDDDTEFVRANNKGCIDVPGYCGDGSAHKLHYVLVGPVGATLKIKMTCDGNRDIGMPDLEVYPPGPVQGGNVDFDL